jgi:hypothetical protein
MNHRARVLIQKQAHCDGVHVVDVAPGAIVEVCGEMLHALQANPAQVFR